MDVFVKNSVFCEHQRREGDVSVIQRPDSSDFSMKTSKCSLFHCSFEANLASRFVNVHLKQGI